MCVCLYNTPISHLPPRLMHVTQNSALAMTGTETTRLSAGRRCDPPAAAQSRTRRNETIAAEDAAELTPVGIKYSLLCNCEIIVYCFFPTEPIRVDDSDVIKEYWMFGGDPGGVCIGFASKSDARRWEEERESGSESGYCLLVFTFRFCMCAHIFGTVNLNQLVTYGSCGVRWRVGQEMRHQYAAKRIQA